MASDFSFDAGLAPQKYAKSSACDDTMVIHFTDWTRADRARRQIIEQIQTCENTADVDDYMTRESLMIDALFLFSPNLSESIEEAARNHRAYIDPATKLPVSNPSAAAPRNPNLPSSQEDKTCNSKWTRAEQAARAGRF